MNFTPEFIASQLAIAEKATPRPWEFDADEDIPEITGIMSPHKAVFSQDRAFMESGGGFLSEQNMKYIVVAANHYPDALREIARLREFAEWVGDVANAYTGVSMSIPVPVIDQMLIKASEAMGGEG